MHSVLMDNSSYYIRGKSSDYNEAETQGNANMTHKTSKITNYDH